MGGAAGTPTRSRREPGRRPALGVRRDAAGGRLRRRDLCGRAPGRRGSLPAARDRALRSRRGCGRRRVDLLDPAGRQAARRPRLDGLDADRVRGAATGLRAVRASGRERHAPAGAGDGAGAARRGRRGPRRSHPQAEPPRLPRSAAPRRAARATTTACTTTPSRPSSRSSASSGPAPDLDGLRAVYAAWCGAVAFDNVLKLIHLADERSGPLPGSTAESFFEAWLEHGTGGTCWSGNGALHDLLEALGFDVARAIATMLSSPEAPGAEPRLGDRDRRRRALDRRRLDPQRRADPHPRRGRARGRRPASPVRVAGQPALPSSGVRRPPPRASRAGSSGSGPTRPNGTSATSARATGARSTTSSTRGCCGVGRASASPGASATRSIRTARSRRASSTRTSVSSFSSRSSASPRRSPSRCPTTGRCRRARDPIGLRSRVGGCRARDA